MIRNEKVLRYASHAWIISLRWWLLKDFGCLHIFTLDKKYTRFDQYFSNGGLKAPVSSFARFQHKLKFCVIFFGVAEVTTILPERERLSLNVYFWLRLISHENIRWENPLRIFVSTHLYILHWWWQVVKLIWITLQWGMCLELNLPTSLTYHRWQNVGKVLRLAHCCQNATAYDCAVGLNAVWTFDCRHFDWSKGGLNLTWRRVKRLTKLRPSA